VSLAPQIFSNSSRIHSLSLKQYRNTVIAPISRAWVASQRRWLEILDISPTVVLINFALSGASIPNNFSTATQYPILFDIEET
jgi:hypothetical protein